MSTTTTLTKARRNVARLEGELAEAEQRHAKLEGERGRVALQKGDLDAHHIALFSATETIKTLRSGLALAKEAVDAAAAKEKRADLEVRAHDLRANTLPQIALTRTEVTRALRDVVSMIEDMVAAKAAIEAFNDDVRQADSDLTIRIDHDVLQAPALPFRAPTLGREPDEDDASFSVRQQAADAAWAAQRHHAERPFEPLEDGEAFRARQVEAMRKVRRHNNETDASLAQRKAVAKAEVVRLGETEDAYARRRLGAKLGVFQSEGEGAAGFDLRVANAQSRYQRQSVTGDDELRQAGEMAINAITHHALGLGAFERDRKFPASFNPHAVIGADGRPVVKPHLWPEAGKLRLRPVKLT